MWKIEFVAIIYILMVAAFYPNFCPRTIYKGNIRRIISIAWKPKRKVKSMADLLESVEELNPENKKTRKGFRFPFSTVLVEGINIGRVWIDRTGYKTLTSTAKKEKGRTDRKFYEIARLQVKRYREFIGETGETRLGQERTPTPLEESPEPQGSSRNGQGTPAQQSGPDQSGLAQSERGQNERGQSERGQNERGQSRRGQSGRGQSGPDQDGQSVINHRNNKPRNTSSFYESWLNENKLPKDTDPDKLSQEEFGKLKAAAHSYVDKYTADTGHQVDDDMNILG